MKRGSEPLVSAVIPFYSGVEWLFEAVESVLVQTYKNTEVIVINDGSEEDLSSFLEEFSNRITYFKQSNSGPAVARNLGIERAAGDYIAFLDSDDRWKPEKLKTQVSAMIEYRAIWSHTDYQTFDNESGRTLKSINLEHFSGNIYPKCLVSNHIATPAVIVKRDVLLANSDLRFKKDMRFGQDVYLWFLLAKRYSLLHVPKPLTEVRIRGTNAAIRARSHLQVRAHLWRLLKDHDAQVFTGRKLVMVKITYQLCSWGLMVLEYIEIKMKLSNRMSEVMAKMLYFLPFLMYRILRPLYK